VGLHVRCQRLLLGQDRDDAVHGTAAAPTGGACQAPTSFATASLSDLCVGLCGRPARPKSERTFDRGNTVLGRAALEPCETLFQELEESVPSAPDIQFQ
jgi:hypothetical protein